MFKIDNNTIHITRGDKATINLTIEDYIFKSGDKIEFRVYNKGFLNKTPVLEEEIAIATNKRLDSFLERTEYEIFLLYKTKNDSSR